MILINRLFKRAKIRYGTAHAVKIKKDIFDFFHVDLKSMPDNTFIESRLRLNKNNEIVKKFRKKLTYREYNIFDYLEVEYIDGKHWRITFKCFSPKKIRLKYLKQLINDLAFIYGKDGVGREQFTEQDKTEFKQREFFDVFGRLWLDYNKYKHPVIISRDKNELLLRIWGTEM